MPLPVASYTIATISSSYCICMGRPGLAMIAHYIRDAPVAEIRLLSPILSIVLLLPIRSNSVSRSNSLVIGNLLTPCRPRGGFSL
jgi:hypothetical protein